jgi:hypothetical protein
VCWKPRSSCWSFHLLREKFLSAPIHSPPLWFAYRSFNYHLYGGPTTPYQKLALAPPALPPRLPSPTLETHHASRSVFLQQILPLCCSLKNSSRSIGVKCPPPGRVACPYPLSLLLLPPPILPHVHTPECESQTEPPPIPLPHQRQMS